MVGVDVVDVPVPLEIADLAQDFLAAVRVDGGHRHGLAAHVHVGLVVLKPGGPPERVEVLRDGDLARSDVEPVAGSVEHPQAGAVLGNLALRIEPESQLHMAVPDLPADRVEMHLPPNPRPGQHELAGAFGEDLADLADGPLHEQPGAAHGPAAGGQRGGLGRHLVGILVLDQVGKGVVRDPDAVRKRGPDLDGLHPALLGKSGLGRGTEPLVLGLGGQRVRLGADDQVGFPEALGELPHARIRELRRGRQVRLVAKGHVAVEPGDEGVHLLVGQAPIVLELLNADGAVDVPRRHDPRGHLLADARRVALDGLVGHERHRRDRPRLVADLTVLLEYRRHVARECRMLLRDRGSASGHEGKGEREACDCDPVNGLPAAHVVLLTVSA